MSAEKKKLAILISGRGSNMLSIMKACEDEDYPAQIAVVLSNRPDAKGLDSAENAGIPAICVNHKDYPDRESFERALITALAPYTVDLVILAGFMRVLTPVFIRHFEGKILNIHPSLLPDYKGLDTHARAIADGKKEAGCTVHYVVPELDSGPIIVQKRVPILAGDTPDTLAARVLEQEHAAYPEAIRIALSVSA